MIRGIYAIWDIKADDLVADVLTVHRHDGTAVRMFTDALQGKGDLANHPEDYKLVKLGTISQYNDDEIPCEPEIVVTDMADVYTGLEWLRAKRSHEAGNGGEQVGKPPLSFPGMPTSDR